MERIAVENQCKPRQIVVNLEKVYWYEIGKDGEKYETTLGKDAWAAIQRSKPGTTIFVKSELIVWRHE